MIHQLKEIDYSLTYIIDVTVAVCEPAYHKEVIKEPADHKEVINDPKSKKAMEEDTTRKS